MRDHFDELGDAAVALVTFTRQRNLRGYRRRLDLPYPVLADEDRHCYRGYGLGRAPVWRAYGLSTLRRYAELVRQGHRPGRPTEDTLQLGGDFVVGRDGRLVYAFRSQSPDERPAVDELVEAVRAA
ncbi:MAG TPA: AhpC/TSA family protein [Acidimicrobiales bacterium]